MYFVLIPIISQTEHIPKFAQFTDGDSALIQGEKDVTQLYFLHTFLTVRSFAMLSLNCSFLFFSLLLCLFSCVPDEAGEPATTVNPRKSAGDTEPTPIKMFGFINVSQTD